MHEQCCRLDFDLYCIAGEGIATAARPQSVHALLDPNAFDGIIMSTGTMVHDESADEVEEFLARFGRTPIVSIATQLRQVASVLVDNRSAVRSLTAHLIEAHRRRRIAFVRVASPEGDLRFEGYRAALEEHGIPFDPDLVVLGEFTLDSGLDAIRILFDERRTAVEALVACNDWIALGAIEGLYARGLQVPGDLAVVGFDDVEDARFASPPLTSVRQPVAELGIAAVKQMARILGGESVELTYPIPVRLEMRQSCGCGLAAHWQSQDVRNIAGFRRHSRLGSPDNVKSCAALHATKRTHRHTTSSAFGMALTRPPVGNTSVPISTREPRVETEPHREWGAPI